MALIFEILYLHVSQILGIIMLIIWILINDNEKFNSKFFNENQVKK